jgi:hypothetical protein
MNNKIIFEKRELKNKLEKEIVKELTKIYRAIPLILPATLAVYLRHKEPDYSLFKEKDRDQILVNLFHLGEIDQEKSREIIRIDAENITKNIINNLLKV